jgi:MFS family permease
VALWAFPLYALMSVGAPAAIWFGQVVATIFQTGLWAVLPALLGPLFPAHLRYTGMSLCYQGASVLGGLAPMVATWLLSISGGQSWPIATMLCVAAGTSALGAFLCRRPRHEIEALEPYAVAVKSAEPGSTAHGLRSRSWILPG